MKKGKQKQLEQAGWVVAGTQEFLGLSDAEMALVDMRVALSSALRCRRQAAGMSQTALAERVGSSQSRVAKMEACDPSVSLDLLIRSLLVTGASASDIANVIHPLSDGGNRRSQGTANPQTGARARR